MGDTTNWDSNTAKNLAEANLTVVSAEDKGDVFILTLIEDYALAHGITGEILKTWGWFETVYQNRRALQFPTPAGNRWRFIDGGKQTCL